LAAGLQDAAGNAFVHTANGGQIANIDAIALPIIDTVAPSLGATAPNATLAAALAGDIGQVRALGAQARADAQALHWDRLVHSLETELLRVADAYQRVTDWHRRHPGL
jgi:hypothetical protein